MCEKGRRYSVNFKGILKFNVKVEENDFRKMVRRSLGNRKKKN